MKVMIRPESAKEPKIMNMLQQTATRMINILYANGIELSDNSMKVWIKEFDGRYYPKIEIDSYDQELQYDLNADGEILETHFKSFKHTKSYHKRVDLCKEEAHPVLAKIDTLLRPSITE